jgi:hypothetical protein
MSTSIAPELGDVSSIIADRPDSFIVSTPNRLYYAEARAGLGPNPFHVHEFEFQEFRAELKSVFPDVVIYLENHTNAIVFTETGGGSMDGALDQIAATPEEAHFFLAVCGLKAGAPVPGFTWVPRAANMLHEREQHIEVVETELQQRIARVVQLQDELADEQAKARARIDQLEADTTRLVSDLDAQVAELGKCVEYLHAAERTVNS